ncbi:hypothetical protein Patl1_03995 [Pistacia atlantica]|uniref:Uncharacterized protein n=1 Tax=Pistacia atlantica TaxID=434234 RepID=A0ACC1BX19_9ROSI|nr:hypothetical protein Patl1_03995 [Pistacia atlantica]
MVVPCVYSPSLEIEGTKRKQPRNCSNTAVEIVDGNFSWDISSLNQTLSDINLRVFHGMTKPE